MTTPAAARLYLAQHEVAMEGRGWAVHNPDDKPLKDLPIIYGFNNGGRASMLSAIAIAADGTCLGSHCCSAEGYMPCDLGILEGSAPDLHETFRKHYPGGYRMAFVAHVEIEKHEGLQEAFRLNTATKEAEGK